MKKGQRKQLPHCIGKTWIQIYFEFLNAILSHNKGTQLGYIALSCGSDCTAGATLDSNETNDDNT